MADLEKAIRIAAQAHQGQRDKGGELYILHPLRVMLQMALEEERIAAVLHDIIEDTDWTEDGLRKEGFSEEVLEVVDCLTRKENESYDEFIERVRLNSIATRIKLADLEDNMDLKRITEPTEEDWERAKKYHWAWLRLRNGPR